MLKNIIKYVLLNHKRPIYSEKFALFCKKYLELWYGDNDFDRKTNGEKRFLESLSGKIKIAFDVGANVGDYAKDIKQFNQNSEIHCFEPDKRAFKNLSKIPGINANNFALGEENVKKILYLNTKSSHNSFFQIENEIGREAVEIKTLDSYVNQNNIAHIDYLKIDTEGYEYKVLLGAKNTIARKMIKYIQFEFSGANVSARVFLKDFIDLLEPAGYTLFRIRAKDIYQIVWSPDMERFTLTNYVAIRNDV